MDWRIYFVVLALGMLVGVGGMYFALRQQPDCSAPQSCLVGKMLFLGAWRAID